jgi:hypothetical protein
VSTSDQQPNLEALAVRLTELEEANKRPSAELTAQHAASTVASTPVEADADQPDRPSSRSTSRRRLLGTAGTVAAATVGAGVLLAAGAGTARANGTETATEFTDNGIWAVFGDATNASHNDGANGVQGISDTGDGVFGASGFTGTGVEGFSYGGPGVAGTTHSASTYGVLGSNLSVSASGIAVLGHSDDGALGLGPGIGVKGESGSGVGVHAFCQTGTALRAQCTASSGVAIRAEGLLQVTGAAVGQITLAAHTSAVTEISGAATPNSIIVLTPLDDPDTRLWVSRAAGSFTIHASTPPHSSVSIAYLIVN